MRRLLVLPLLGVLGCANILGLGDYADAVDGAADAKDGGSDAKVEAATVDAVADAVADARVDADGGGDVGVDATPDASGCVPTGAELCSDGVDNDCNGQTDCTDPACTAGYTCVPPLPNGWSWTAYDQGARPTCATGFTTPTDVDEGPIAPAATCGCGCTTTSPTCTGGTLTVTGGTTGVNGCQDGTNRSESAIAGCRSLSLPINAVGWKVNATGPVPSGGSCTASPTVNKFAVSYEYQGRTCAFAGNVGAGCGGGDVCAPKAAPFTMCVAAAGDLACPTGFLVKHPIGTVVTDTRGCSACTCALNPGTCGGALTLYSDSACSLGAAPVTVNGTCQSVANASYVNYTYASQSNGSSCAGSAVAATGSAAFSDLRTVCCVN